MRPRNVALLSNFLAPYRIELMGELAARFEKLSILLSTPMEPDRDWKPVWGDLPVHIQRNLSISVRVRHPQFADRTMIQIPYDTVPQLARRRPDVVVAGELGARTAQAAIYRRLFRRGKLVIWATLSERTEENRGLLRRCLRRILLRSADAVIVNGESGARYVSRFGVDKARIFRAPQTTRIEPFLELPSTRPDALRRRLLYSGQLIPRKGLLAFAAALAEWGAQHAEQSVEIGLVGDGPARAGLTSFQWPRNVTARFFGSVEYQRLPEIYGQAGMLVLPTLADEWGLVVVEAMAAGLPVLGSLYSQAVEELVVDGRNGWTFRPDHPSGMRSAIHRALSASVGELNQMAENARQDISGLTPSAMAEQMAAAINYAFASHT